MMSMVSVHKAQPIGNQTIESVALIIDETLPVFGSDLERSTQLFDEDAQRILDALHSLPGGTLDRVLVKLLSEKVSQHLVPWERRG